jgi:hypothetical protein
MIKIHKEEATMLVITFSLGIVVGIVLIIGFLRLTATTNPAGCILALGGLIFLLFWFGLVIPGLISAD